MIRRPPRSTRTNALFPYPTHFRSYTAMAYFTPILGGAIADRWLGKRNPVVLGGSIMAIGHFVMAFEPRVYFALATIALGNGLFLPPLPSPITDLYAAAHPRRAHAHTINYASRTGSAPAPPPLLCT